MSNNEQLEAIKKERDEALALLHEAYRAKNAALDCFEKENKIAYLRMAELENERDEALAKLRKLQPQAMFEGPRCPICDYDNTGLINAEAEAKCRERHDKMLAEALARVRELEKDYEVVCANHSGLSSQLKSAEFRTAELEAENAALHGLRRMLGEKESSGKYTERAGLLRFLVVDDGSISARIAENERLRVAFDRFQPMPDPGEAMFGQGYVEGQDHLIHSLRAAIEGKDT
jgi:DNA repair exonuclease SbcCD ATPase subunit